MACCKKVYTVPKFNLQVDIYSGNMLGSIGAFRFLSWAQLAYGDLDATGESLPTMNTNWGKLMYLLLPALTDVRTVVCGPLVFNDFVECPRLSNRWYQVMHVDDRWKGFPTEHRVAHLLQTVGPFGAGWGFPIN